MKRVILTILIAVAFSAFAAADSITFTLDPASGNVKGNAGSVVGWGLTLANSGPDWVLLTGSVFDPTAGSDPGVGNGTNYVDYLGGNFYVAGPAPESSTVSSAFDSSLLTGVGEFDINSSAQPGSNAHGNIVVSYSVFSVDPNSPNFNPDTDTVTADATLSAPAMVSVPEPSFLTLLISALFLPLTYGGWRRYIVVRRVALTA
jgi:hypothetical protein